MLVCVPRPNHHQTLSCAVDEPSIHFAPCQSPTTPCLSACCTHNTITLLPKLSFLLLSVVFFIITVLVVVVECITRLHQSSTRCVCHVGAIQCGHHFAICCSPNHCTSHTHASHWTVDVVKWHTRYFKQSTCHPLHQALYLVVAIKMLANDSFHFKVVWQVTIAHTGPMHQSPSSECLPTPHITQHGTMGQKC